MSPRFVILLILIGSCAFGQDDPKPKKKKHSVLDRIPGVPIPPIPPVPGAPGSHRPSSGKCKAYMGWMSNLTKENPYPDFLKRGEVQEQVPNLFRDDLFAPAHGKPFGQLSEAERLEHYNQMRACSGNFKGEELQTFYSLLNFVDNRFIQTQGTNSVASTIAAAQDRETLSRWAKEVATGIERIPLTPEGFSELEAITRKAETEMKKTWPREQQALLNLPAIPGRRSLIARAVLEEGAKSAETNTGKGLEGLKAITALRASHQKYVEALGGNTQSAADVLERFERASSSAASSAIAQEKATLAGFPAGIAGVFALNDWRKGFIAAMGKFGSAPEAQALLEAAAQLRKQALAAGLKEFRPIVAAHPKPAYNQTMNAIQLMNSLGLSAEEARLYIDLLYTRLEPSNFGIGGPAAAFKPAPDKTRCDDLAAHPNDPARKAEGVADDDIDVDEAIDACEAAIVKAPNVARYQFQLGRAYWADDDYESAIEYFLKAEAQLYAPAYYYLAQAYKDGLVGDEPADPELAKTLYQLAGAAGFRPAVLAFTRDSRDAKADAADQPIQSFFKRPDWMLGLVVGDASVFTSDRFHGASYLLGMQDWLNAEEHEFDPLCPKKVVPELGARLEHEIAQLAPRTQAERLALQLGRVLGGITPEDGADKVDPEYYQHGVDDISVIVADYGGCSGKAFALAYDTLKAAVR